GLVQALRAVLARLLRLARSRARIGHHEVVEPLRHTREQRATVLLDELLELLARTAECAGETKGFPEQRTGLRFRDRLDAGRDEARDLGLALLDAIERCLALARADTWNCA